MNVKCVALLLGVLVTPITKACEAELRALFDIMKPIASNIVGWNSTPEAAKRISDLAYSHRKADDNGAYARAFYYAGTIVTYESLCEQPLERKQAVMAHEFGHFMGLEIFPKFKSRVDRGVSSYVEEESYADQLGAKILRELKISSDKYLQLLDDACQRGSDYFCRAALNWRAGLAY